MLKQLKFPIAGLMMVAGSAAMAATSATLNLSGTVAAVLFIGFNNTGTTTTANYSFSSSQLVDGFTAVNVGTLYESSNTRTSNYKVTITSANGGKLVHGSVPTAIVNYTMSIENTSVTNDELTAAAEYTIDTSAYTGRVTIPRNITLTGGNTDALAGSYSDTVTFDIAVN